jgi:hypothetical protein
MEETSTNHALATLLIRGKTSMTPLNENQKWSLGDEKLKGDVLIFDGGGRMGVLIQVTNLDPKKPWRLQEVRLSTFTAGEPRPFALRMSPAELLPGKTGRIAIVTDHSSFKTPEGWEKLVLELFRDGGLRQGYVEVERKLKR